MEEKSWNGVECMFLAAQTELLTLFWVKLFKTVSYCHPKDSWPSWYICLTYFHVASKISVNGHLIRPCVISTDCKVLMFNWQSLPLRIFYSYRMHCFVNKNLLCENLNLGLILCEAVWGSNMSLGSLKQWLSCLSKRGRSKNNCKTKPTSYSYSLFNIRIKQKYMKHCARNHLLQPTIHLHDGSPLLVADLIVQVADYEYQRCRI